MHEPLVDAMRVYAYGDDARARLSCPDPPRIFTMWVRTSRLSARPSFGVGSDEEWLQLPEVRW